jgi:hypothetical protein
MIKFKEIFEKVKEEYHDLYDKFESYSDSILNWDISDEFIEYVKEKILHDCSILNYDMYGEYKTEDETNLIEAFNRGIDYTDLETISDEYNSDLLKQNLEENYSQVYDEKNDENFVLDETTYFGEDLIGMTRPII